MEEKKILVAPSILSADFRNLEHEVKAAENAGADMIHCDIMDGVFVPNITFGPLIVETVKKCVSIPLDVHLMIVNPEVYVLDFRNAGADIITVHAEACENLPQVISIIRNSGAKVGITVNPDKPLDLILPHIEHIDQILIMSVYAGFAGQTFIHDAISRIKTVYDALKKIDSSIDIQVDGGINSDTAQLCAENGATVFVAGSYVFSSNNFQQRIECVRAGAQNGRKKLLHA